MYRIRPISDLRNKFSEIEREVGNEGPVFLTKNGCGSMVVMSIEDYSLLSNPVEALLDEADQQAANTELRLGHDEVFGRLRNRVGSGQALSA